MLKELKLESPPGMVIAVEVVSPASRQWAALWKTLVEDLRSALGAAGVAAVEGEGKAFESFFFAGGRAPPSASFENATFALIKVS